MRANASLLSAVGNTPLLRLQPLDRAHSANIYAKLEMANRAVPAKTALRAPSCAPPAPLVSWRLRPRSLCLLLVIWASA